ncbi:putative metallopeptidase [Minicystis rosea]|nr:putative metallopeptidase [Minicystis rosea]
MIGVSGIAPARSTARKARYHRRVRALASIPAFALLFAACSSSPPTSTGTPGGGGTGGVVTPPPTGPITGTVTRYSYAFDLATAHGKSALDVDVAAPGGDCFTVGDRVATTSATWNSAPVTKLVLDGTSMEACGEGVAASSKLVLGAESDVPKKTFLGLDVGFSRRLDQDKGEFAYLLSWVGGCDRFGPCDADPSRLNAFHFEIAHPAGTVVLCPGTRVEGETLTTCDVEGTLAPTYSAFGFAADPLWKKSPFLTAAGIDVVFYETPSGTIAASLQKDDVAAFLGFITDLLGPFPYGKELRFAGAPTTWLGFEHPANVILFEELAGVKGVYEHASMHVLMHETVHQWAGDRSTIAAASDFVWKEATAEYLSYVFEDEHLAPTAGPATLAYWDGISLQSEHFPRPTDDPPPAVDSFYGDVYGPGPMVLYVQLESLLGRKAVLDGIKSFLAEPGARSVADLQAALEQSSGQDLKPYFDAWVYGKGTPEWPTLAIATSQNGDQVTVTVTQQNASGKLYGCKVEIEIDGTDEKALATIDFGAAPTSASASATVTLVSPVTGTILDPNHRLVARAAAAPKPFATPKRKVWIL